MSKEKPPIGVVPRKFWLIARLQDLERAIKEYADSSYPIDEEWIKERNELKETLIDDERR